MPEPLPSWRPGANRDAIVEFLERSNDIPVEDRLACFDNDGTLWVEKPSYVQLDFFVDGLKTAIADNPSVANTPEFAALLNDDKQAQGEIGLARIAMALAGLFAGQTPEEFRGRTRQFMSTAMHVDTGRPLKSMVYQPMIELLAELRRHDFTVAIATGGGTEFVRAISEELYGVPPELVVGTLIEYEYGRTDGGAPGLTRSREIGAPDEGPNKVTHIQEHLGRRPVFAAGNSSGDREMLEWAASDGGFALLVDHDDSDREYSYASLGATTDNAEPIVETGNRLGWTVVSMKDDWESVFTEL